MQIEEEGKKGVDNVNRDTVTEPEAKPDEGQEGQQEQIEQVSGGFGGAGGGPRPGRISLLAARWYRGVSLQWILDEPPQQRLLFLGGRHCESPVFGGTQTRRIGVAFDPYRCLSVNRLPQADVPTYTFGLISY